MDYIVAIDGPSGSGKSTIAREVASRLGGEVLDTGAMYRAVAWFALEHGVEPTDAEKVADLLASFEVHVDGGVGHGLDQMSGEASQKLRPKKLFKGQVRRRTKQLPKRQIKRQIEQRSSSNSPRK